MDFENFEGVGLEFNKQIEEFFEKDGGFWPPNPHLLITPLIGMLLWSSMNEKLHNYTY
jgi:hypothetical protein